MPWDRMPYVIIDYKGEDLLNSIEGVRHVRFKDKLGKSGLHILSPTPEVDDEAVEAYLWKLWKQENTGLFIDEAYQLPDKGALRAILTQGRSKKLPAIILSQRPVSISRFVFSEADFFAIFHLNHQDDDKTVRKFIPGMERRSDMPEYHSRYYDVGKNALFGLRPVPDRDTILGKFYDRAKSPELRSVRFV